MQTQVSKSTIEKDNKPKH